MADEELYGVEDGGGEEGYEGEGGEGEEYNEDGTGAGLEELEAMTRKLKEMEEEAARLKAMQGGAASGDAAAAAAAAGGAGAAAGTSAPASNAGDAAEKEEADGRSIYIGNVDYATTPEELQQHFQSCGTVNRVTILTDRTGNPKGYAYLEFLEVDAVQNAVLLDNSELRGRQIKVSPKRTNVPGLKARGRGRGRGGAGGYPPYGAYPYYPPPYPFYPPPFAPPFAPRGRGRHGPPGFGPAPRGRGRGRFAPY